MEPAVLQETVPYIDEFLRKFPKAIEVFPFLRDEMEKAIQVEQQTAQRARLLRILQRKFGDVPSVIVTVIESTTDDEQLETWLDDVVMADQLTDVDFGLDNSST